LETLAIQLVRTHNQLALNSLEKLHTIKHLFIYVKMITDIQIFLALMVALTAAILAIGLGRQLYI